MASGPVNNKLTIQQILLFVNNSSLFRVPERTIKVSVVHVHVLDISDVRDSVHCSTRDVQKVTRGEIVDLTRCNHFNLQLALQDEDLVSIRVVMGGLYRTGRKEGY